MADDVKDVNTSVPSTEDPVVVEGTTTQEEQQVEEGQKQETSTQEVKPEVIRQPDQRPEINYAMEALRKIDKLAEQFNQFQTQQAAQPAQQQPQYSKAQLRTFAEQTQDPGQKIWALEEVDKIDRTERQKEMRELFETHTKRTEGEVRRQQSTTFVAQNFPQCFAKDRETGNIVGWDNNNPLTIRIGQYMQDPRFAGDPEGLIAAAKMAAFDLGISVGAQRKVSQVTAQLRKEQKRTLISGGGTQVAGDETGRAKQVAKLVEQYRLTKDPKLFTELARLRGLTAPVHQ